MWHLDPISISHGQSLELELQIQPHKQIYPLVQP